MASVAETIADKKPSIPKKMPEGEMFTDVKPSPSKRDSWGFHLLVNMSGTNDNTDSRVEIRRFFKEVVADLKMRTISPLVIEKSPAGEGRGLSAIQMIATSHLAAHFDDQANRAFIDIFSCMPFDDKVVIAAIKRRFAPKHFVSKFIYRNAGRGDPT